ncbi:MAG: hypothetical protein LBS40_01075 [Burkholderiales bacterium]|jgi:hypothetical protein|nr:hypothetical protein [Burkholderiales bacterium]
MSIKKLFRLVLFSGVVLLLSGCFSMSATDKEQEVSKEVEKPEATDLAPPDLLTTVNQELAQIVKDLAHYTTLSVGERQTIQKGIAVSLSDKNTAKDSDRIRHAWLYALRDSIQTDQRALEQLSIVQKNQDSPELFRQYADVLSRLILERLKQLQKLQALTDMESNLLKERIDTPHNLPRPTIPRK